MQERSTSEEFRQVVEASVLPERRARIEQVLAGRTRRLRVVLENIEDNHNLSAVIRSAEGFGVQEIHVVERQGPFEVSPKVTQGCHKWIDLIHHDSVAECVDSLHEQGFQLWAAALDPRAVPITAIDFSRPTALVLGNEKAGLSQALLSRCDGCYIIPMRGFSQSFNVSVAAAISLFYATLPADVHGGGILPGLSADEEEELRNRWLALSVKQAPRIRRAYESGEEELEFDPEREDHQG